MKSHVVAIVLMYIQCLILGTLVHGTKRNVHFTITPLALCNYIFVHVIMHTCLSLNNVTCVMPDIPHKVTNYSKCFKHAVNEKV